MENQKVPSVLKVLYVEDRRDSRINDEQPEGRLYKYVRVQTVGDKWINVPGAGRILAQGTARETGFTAYPVNYLGNADPNSDLAAGDYRSKKVYLMGDIVTRQVEKYDIPGTDSDGIPITRTVDTYSTAVLGDDTKPGWESLVISTFRRKGRVIVGTNIPAYSQEALEEFDKSSDAAAEEGSRVAAEQEEVSNESAI